MMRFLLSSNKVLKLLTGYILHSLQLVQREIVLPPPQKTTTDTICPTTALEPNQEKFQKNHAAKIIQRVFRNYQIKEKIAKNPYLSYLSTLDPKEENYLLSSIMFGQHEAEFAPQSKEKIPNPFIRTHAVYHRLDSHSGPLMDQLLLQFKISSAQAQNCKYIPITPSKNTPILDYIQSLGKRFPLQYKSIRIILSRNHSILLLEFPKNSDIAPYLHDELSAGGYVATLWEIASNIQEIKLPSEIPKQFSISIDPRLPKTKEALLLSRCIGKLNLIISSNRHTTSKLAASLKKLLERMSVSNPNSIQRIALMLDLTHTFYANNYSRYAFCVYTIVHEISLAMAQKRSEEDLNDDFHQFQLESKATLCQSLGIEPQLEHADIFSAPALSGTNAYYLAVMLALKMRTGSGTPPTIKIIEPSYYEFDEIIKSTTARSADIFCISAGPIVTQEGVAPGIDINRFIQRNIIGIHRSNPILIIIDATTALYRNLRLNEAAKLLVREGKLSIIIHESHQKFGLLHTDQAQYGRVFGVCSKNSFPARASLGGKTPIQDLEEKGHLDFNTHMDMRIGAFISVSCKDFLEEIKKQHFKNGAILRRILSAVSFVSPHVAQHQDMLTNTDELYFVSSPGYENKQKLSMVDYRTSFGHFHTVRTWFFDQTRICPDASDAFDCLIQTAKIYLANYFTLEKLMKIIIDNGYSQEPLSIGEQIVFLSILHNICSSLSLNSIALKDLFPLYSATNNIISLCTRFRGRYHFMNTKQWLFDIENRIMEKCRPFYDRHFLKKIRTFYHGQDLIEAYQQKSDHFFEILLQTTPIPDVYTIINSSSADKSQKKKFSNAFLIFQLNHLIHVTSWQEILTEKKLIKSQIDVTKAPEKSKQILKGLQQVIMTNKFDISFFLGVIIFDKLTGTKHTISEGMSKILKEIKKAEKGKITWDQAVQNVELIVTARSERKKHVFFHQDGETKQHFYEEIKKILKELQKEQTEALEIETTTRVLPHPSLYRQ